MSDTNPQPNSRPNRSLSAPTPLRPSSWSDYAFPSEFWTTNLQSRPQPKDKKKKKTQKGEQKKLNKNDQRNEVSSHFSSTSTPSASGSELSMISASHNQVTDSASIITYTFFPVLPDTGSTPLRARLRSACAWSDVSLTLTFWWCRIRGTRNAKSHFASESRSEFMSETPESAMPFLLPASELLPRPSLRIPHRTPFADSLDVKAEGYPVPHHHCSPRLSKIASSPRRSYQENEKNSNNETRRPNDLNIATCFRPHLHRKPPTLHPEQQSEKEQSLSPQPPQSPTPTPLTPFPPVPPNPSHTPFLIPIPAVTSSSLPPTTLLICPQCSLTILAPYPPVKQREHCIRCYDTYNAGLTYWQRRYDVDAKRGREDFPVLLEKDAEEDEEEEVGWRRRWWRVVLGWGRGRR